MRVLLVVVAIAAVACACKAKDPPRVAPPIATDGARTSDAAPIAAPGERKPGTRVAVGPLRATEIVDGYAVIVPAGGDPQRARRAIETAAKSRGVSVDIHVTAANDLHLTGDLLAPLGRGLTPADVTALGAAVDGVAFDVRGPSSSAATLLHASAAIARAGAAEVHGWIQDGPTGETFTLASFDQRRPDGFPLDVTTLVVIHEVADQGAGVFLDTMGMARFGLPDLYIGHVPRSYSSDMGQLVNAAAQTLVDEGAIASSGELAVDLSTLTTGSWPDERTAVANTNGSGKVAFIATWSSGPDRDASELPVIELSIAGTPTDQALLAAMGDFLGSSPDSTIAVEANDPELIAARARAAKQIASLAPHFAKGVPELEKLAVKAPFTTDDGGTEWMWVEVQSWTGDRITGILINDPDKVASLKFGAHVEVSQSKLFDYIHQRADGTKVGNETAAILERHR